MSDRVLGPKAVSFAVDHALGDDGTANDPYAAIRNLANLWIVGNWTFTYCIIHRFLRAADSPDVIFIVGIVVRILIRRIDGIARFSALAELACPGYQDIVSANLEDRFFDLATIFLTICKGERRFIRHTGKIRPFKGLAVIS